jgi:hypothetical protein
MKKGKNENSLVYNSTSTGVNKFELNYRRNIYLRSVSVLAALQLFIDCYRYFG